MTCFSALKANLRRLDKDLAIDIRVKTITVSHPIVNKLFSLGEGRLVAFGCTKKRFITVFERKLRWTGAFLVAAKWYPKLDRITDAVFVLVLRELGYEDKFDKARNELKVQDDLLFAVDALLGILEPITERSVSSQHR